MYKMNVGEEAVSEMI